MQIVLRYRMGWRQYCMDLLGVTCGTLCLFDLGEHDHEFISSMTTHGVRPANGVLQALSHRLQEPVGGEFAVTLEFGCETDRDNAVSRHIGQAQHARAMRKMRRRVAPA